VAVQPDLTRQDPDLFVPDAQGGKTSGVELSEPEFVQFGKGSARLIRASRRVLDKMAEMIKSGPRDGVIRVEGHADRTENRRAVLSLKRSRAVCRYLIAKGVDASRLKAVGLGSTRPLAPSTSPAGRQENRRVDFTFREQGP
jgi:OOP family OmpA-OmpF porin